MPATYYDGRSSRPLSVTLELRDGTLVVRSGETVLRDQPLDAAEITEVLGSAPRRVQFDDGAFCEVRDLAGLAELLAQAGHREGLVSLLQRHVGAIVVSILASGLVTVAAFLWGLPALASLVTKQLPLSADQRLGEHALEALDRGLFLPSKLDAARREAIAAGFARIASGRRKSEVAFRSAPLIGPNALTLPDGTIVLLDELVALLDDDEITAVLAHELGHARLRHPLRMLLQGSAMAAIWTLYVGDVSSLLAIAPTALLQARYSRGLEEEADDFAVAALRAGHLSPALLADALEKLEAEVHKKRPDSDTFTYLDSHPATRERIRHLRAVAGAER